MHHPPARHNEMSSQFFADASSSAPRTKSPEQASLKECEKHKYVMDLGEGEVIDASQRGSILRFVNHSCGPNAETQKWTVQGTRRIGLFALHDIDKGEEVRKLGLCAHCAMIRIVDFGIIGRCLRV